MEVFAFLPPDLSSLRLQQSYPSPSPMASAAANFDRMQPRSLFPEEDHSVASMLLPGGARSPLSYISESWVTLKLLLTHITPLIYQYVPLGSQETVLEMM